jgi:TatD DNase family protein
MIDSHCHLAGKEFASDLDAVIARASEAGVARCLVILGAEDDEEIAQAEAVAAAWPVVRFAVGVHPHQAHRFAAAPEVAADLVASRLDEIAGTCAIGEIGLDYHYDFSPKDVQDAVFRAQLRLARERKLPVVIHTREAEEDTLRVIQEEGAGDLRGVFHCFSGDAAAAARALATGFHISIPGIATFPKGGELREAVKQVPENRLLIETDSPYLAPVPFRGKRNEPAYVLRVLDTVAEARGVAREALGTQLVANFDNLFTR